MNTIKLEDVYDRWFNTFTDIANTAIGLSKERQCQVEFEFNGSTLVSSPDSTEDALWKEHTTKQDARWAEEERKRIEYLRTPEGIAETARFKVEQAAKEKRRAEILALRKDPKWRDQAAWALCYEVNNTNPYGACILEFASTWASLMQGVSPDRFDTAAADECSQVADEIAGGITGFMYGCAVQILSKCWIYGEDMRKWHNKEYNHEGDGVVNPAILKIGGAQ